MRYSLNLYDENSEVIKTVETNFVPVSIFIKALDMSEKMKDMSVKDQFNAMTEIILIVFKKLTKKELENNCDINDVMNVFRQIVNRANDIKN